MAERKNSMGDDPLAWLADESGEPEKATPQPKRTRSRRGAAKVKSETELLEESFAALAPQGEALAARFYERLLANYPELAPLFSGVSIAGQQKKLLASLVLLVQNLHKPDVLKDYLSGLGARHVHYGVVAEHYPMVAENLLAVMAEFAGSLWTDEVKQAWENTLNNVATIMLEAYEPTEADEMAISKQTESEELIRMRSAVDGAMTAIMMIDRDFNITYVNDSTVAMLKPYESVIKQILPKFDLDNLVGSNIDDFHKDPSRQRKLLADPKNLPYSTDIQVGPLSFNLNVTAIMDDHGTYLGNALEWQNVTEVRKKEAEVIRLQGTVDGAKTSIMMIDRDFNVTYANESTINMLTEYEDTLRTIFPGFSAKDIVGSNIDAYHKNPAHQRKLLADPNNLPYNTDIQVGPLSFNLNVTAIMDADNNYVGTALEWMNNTDNKNALAAYEGQLDAISKAMGVISFELDGTIIDINENFLNVVGYSRDEVIGKHHRMFAEPALAASQEYVNFWAKLNRGEFDAGEYKRIGKGGKEIWLQASYNPILDLNGKPVKVIKYAADITEQKQLQFTIEAMLSSISEVMNAMADGDLTKLVEGVYEGEFEALQSAVNSTVTKMSETVKEINEAATNISSGASEISEGNTDLSQRTEEQASSLEETASSMEELTSTVRQNSDNARQANQLAVSSREQAEKGGQVIKSAIEAMAAISASSRKVSDIIGVIDEIAFQTNLLALNAAVEAARAGEQGRGFAVVASEVRNLAQRSASAAKEIKELINDSGEKVKEGSMLVDESGRTLEEIVASSKKVGDIISEIAAAGAEQTQGIEQVNKAVTQMDEMTQQNAALVEQAAAASESLDEQGKQLQRLMAFFNIGEESSHRPVAKQAKPAAPAPRPQAQPKVESKPRPKSTQSDDEWDEF
jgi:methyl-accepting chemotaxis protein